MILKKQVLGMSVLTALAGCTDQFLGNDASGQIETTDVRIEASINDGSTSSRTAIGGIDSETRKLWLEWTQDEFFSVAGWNNYANGQFVAQCNTTSSVSEDMRTINFDAGVPTEATEIMFFYPRENDDKNWQQNSLERTLPLTQYVNDFGKANLMRTDLVSVASLDNQTVGFKQLVTIVRYNFTNIPDNRTISSINLKCLDDEDVSTLFTKVTTSVSDGTVTDSYSGKTESGVTLENTNEEETGEFFMSILPPEAGKTSTVKVTIGLSDGSYREISTAATDVIKDISAGEYLTMNIDVNKAEETVPPSDIDTDGVLTTYQWPVGEGQAKLSEHYEVYVTPEGGQEQKVEVLQSDAIVNNIGTDGLPGEDAYASLTKKRTFSFAMISYDETKGKKLTFRVVSKDGYSNPEVAPKSYNISTEPAGSSVVFSVDKSNRYVAVNFNCSQNIVKQNNGYNWVKHMLVLFVDPMEQLKPDPAKQKIVYYSDNVTNNELANADVIYFKPGYYNLKNNPTGSMINSNGGLTLTSNQEMYIAGGAFVEGYIIRKNYGDQNQKFYGRGIISGRQYTWLPGASEADGRIKQLMMGAKYSVFDGIMIMESPNHGIVSTNDCTFRNVKMLGWHCNNDGLRPGNNSKISNCFLRAYDDFFYNYSLDVRDCVLWPGWNGSIMTNGWNNIDIGGSLVENIDIIYPEWFSMGNNRGLIMSQNDYAFNPPAGSKQTVFRNIRFEGKIPGFVNLKPNSGYKTDRPLLTNKADLGWMGNILLENISIEEHESKPNNLIQGGCPAVEGDPSSTWWVKDVTLRNITIGGTKVTDANKSKWFTIDEKTTSNIKFE